MLVRAVRRIASVIAECHYAQGRMMALRMTPDRYLHDKDAPADTYAEFLFRVSGPLLHEPSAASREHGQRLG